MEQTPIFTVKEGLDPFELYGPITDDDENENEDTKSISSLKVRLALLQQRYKDEEEEEENSSLDFLVKMNPRKRRKKKKKKDFNSNKTLNERILKHLEEMKTTFSAIFQALIFLIERPSEKQSEKISKRSREFETRLNRIDFELKQRVHTLKGSILRSDLRGGEDIHLILEAKSNLCQALRSGLTVLQSYQRHLPFTSDCGGKVQGMDRVLDHLESLFQATISLKFGEASSLLQDVDRLSTTLKDKSSHHATKRLPSKKSEKKEEDMIDFLAKRKFGSPKKDPESVIRRQRIIKAKAKRYGKIITEDNKEEEESVHGNDTKVLINHVENIETRMEEIIRKLSASSSPTTTKKRESFRSIEIEDDELNHILDFKKEFEPTDRDSVKLVSIMADEITSEILFELCSELVSPDLIQNLLGRELM